MDRRHFFSTLMAGLGAARYGDFTKLKALVRPPAKPSQLTYLASIYYRKKGLESLQKKFQFRDSYLDFPKGPVTWFSPQPRAFTMPFYKAPESDSQPPKGA